MSMISDLVDRLRAESKSMGKYGVDYMATLLMQASDTIIMLSEKARADRLQGEWIRDRYWSRGVGMGEDYGFFYKCSLCEYEVENGYTRCGFNFCPNCGAKMKGADDE